MTASTLLVAPSITNTNKQKQTKNKKKTRKKQEKNKKKRTRGERMQIMTWEHRRSMTRAHVEDRDDSAHVERRDDRVNKTNGRTYANPLWVYWCMQARPGWW